LLQNQYFEHKHSVGGHAWIVERSGCLIVKAALHGVDTFDYDACLTNLKLTRLSGDNSVWGEFIEVPLINPKIALATY
jgi:hypothetical protein